MMYSKILLLIFLSAATVSYAQDKSAYKILNRIHLDGDGGWDYLTMDEDAAMLYVSHGNMVQVIDTKTSNLVATIVNTKGVHGIAIAQGSGKGYISCGRDSTIVVFDTKTFKTLSRIKISGANPDAILYDPYSKNVYTFNGRSENVTVIAVSDDKVIGSIVLEGRPEFSATDEHGKIYVNIEDKSQLCMIDVKTLKAEKYWPVAPLEEPSGLAIDNVNHRLISVSDGKMAIIDGISGKLIASLLIGDRVDGVAYDRVLKRAYSANGDGTMTVVAEINGKYKVLENVATQEGARTIAVNSKTHHIYLPTAEYSERHDKGKGPYVKGGSFTVLEIAPVSE